MNKIVVAAAVALLIGAADARAQEWQGFAIAGMGSMTGGRPADNPDYMDHSPEVSVGVLHTLGSQVTLRTGRRPSTRGNRGSES